MDWKKPTVFIGVAQTLVDIRVLGTGGQLPAGFKSHETKDGVRRASAIRPSATQFLRELKAKKRKYNVCLLTTTHDASLSEVLRVHGLAQFVDSVCSGAEDIPVRGPFVLVDQAASSSTDLMLKFSRLGVSLSGPVGRFNRERHQVECSPFMHGRDDRSLIPLVGTIDDRLSRQYGSRA